MAHQKASGLNKEVFYAAAALCLGQMAAAHTLTRPG